MNFRSAPTIVPFILLFAGLALAYSTGPPDSRTGAPAEQTCADGCHTSFVLNSGSGTLALSGPSTYTVGDTLDIQVNLGQSSQMRWGFEITVLDGTDLPAGSLILSDVVRQQISTAVSGREYLKHTSVGTDLGTANNAPGWTIRWYASAGTSGPVTFYAAGNAANGNGDFLGDYIYTTSLQLDQSFDGCCFGVAVGNVDGMLEPYGVDVVDLTGLIDHLFINFQPLACPEEGDLSTPPDGVVDVADLTLLIDHLFINFTPLPACH